MIRPAPHSCWHVLGLAPGSSADAIQSAWRVLAAQCHPDRGGTDAAIIALNAARAEALREIGVVGSELALIRHYKTVRDRLWPVHRRLTVTAQSRQEWSGPVIVEVATSDEQRISAILRAAALVPRPTARVVIRATASAFGVPVDDVTGNSRSAHHVKPRQIAMAITRYLIAGSPHGKLGALGLSFDRDHTTVLHAVRKYRGAVEAAAAQLSFNKEART